MVKADVRRDYYADLGLGPTADTDEIKKQFRKLALKYHPDRNPGKETEFITKFQAIQAANEILGDPQQRLKYDTERLRAGYGRLYAPPPSNNTRRANTSAYATAKAATPKPSRPTPYQPPPSRSAETYASYAKAAPQRPVYEQQTRADAFRAFSGMKSHVPGWSKFDPMNGKPGPSPPTRSNTAAGTTSSQSRRSAYEYMNNRQHPAAFGRASTVKKKQGFAPGTPGGDEPMARNFSSYAPRTDRSSAFFDSVPSPTAKRTPTSSRPETPIEDPAPEFERTSHPYARTGGERTYFSSAGLGRSHTMRESSSSRVRSRTNPPSPTSPVSSRHRSASPKLRQRKKYAEESSTSSSSEGESDSDSDYPTFVPRQKATPRGRLRPSQKFHFQSSGLGEEILEHSNPQAHAFRIHRRLRNYLGEDRRHSYHEFQDHRHDSDSASFVFRAQQAAQAANATPQANLGVPGFGNQNVNSSPNNGTKSRSHDNLNQRFSASDWGDAIRPEIFAPNKINGHQRSRSRTSPMRGRPASRTDLETQPNAVPPSDEAMRQQASTLRPPSQFSAEAWAQHLQNTNWAARNPNSENAPSQSLSQSRAGITKPGRKISRPTSRTTKPQQPAVSTEAEEESTTIPQPDQSAQGQSTHVLDAMDIDDELPEPTKTATNGIKQPQSPASKANVSTGNASKIPEQPNDLFNLGHLHNVAPFTSTNSGGIDDLKDMFTTLPFESRANDSATKQNMTQGRKFDLPSPPKRPQKPAVVPLGNDPRNMVLPRQSWEAYVKQICVYLTEWNNFQKQMLEILIIREAAFETGLAPRWIDAIGDSIQLNVASENSGPAGNEADGSEAGGEPEILIPDHPHGGYKAYLNSIDEHAKIREYWDVANERHRECILQLGELREWIRTRGKIV
ncbi:DnaJ domain protein [Talaromyces proteolyticus]|uniref:DnaJ domain protein n=1 Tax=Talaromyces proteolyticus TaxID=1131652 RepID=A0AAD4KWZ4_9EURO|nr:DnaJ domain protein [Talaromyces proteolyticus]KAH8698748.1 DnaJ domain protein [Talaromyces proteolyticus]